MLSLMPRIPKQGTILLSLVSHQSLLSAGGRAPVCLEISLWQDVNFTWAMSALSLRKNTCILPFFFLMDRDWLRVWPSLCCCIHFPGLPQQMITNWCLQTIAFILSQTFCRAQVQHQFHWTKSRYRQGQSPTRGSRGESISYCFQFLIAASILWLVASPQSACMLTLPPWPFCICQTSLCLPLLRIYVIALKINDIRFWTWVFSINDLLYNVKVMLI